MDSTKTESARRPRRFQVDPLASLATPEIESGYAEGGPRFEQLDVPEIPLQQRIEVLSLEDVQPDPWNPRHILPADIRGEYISGKISARVAVQRWVKAGEKNAEIADQIQTYRSMGVSLLDQGQINPITVAKHFREDGSFVWRIESGERRYWAKWLMVFDGQTDDCTIHALIRDELNPTRQAVENIQTASLTAVGEARQVARLFLDRLEITPESEIARGVPSGSDDYFRLALSPADRLLADRKRLPRGFWPALEEIMGSKRQHLERKMQILRLPDGLLSFVDDHQLTERQLREILANPEELWERLVMLTIEHDLTGPELSRFVEGEESDATMQMILDHRSALPVIADEKREVDITPVEAGEGEKDSAQVFQRRIVSFARYFQRTRQSLESDEDLDHTLDDLIQTGEYQIVLENLELLVERLKSRLAEL
ncbi:MAG: hypothetical protein FJ010_13875 [Chloroflexi bacterium]|nr:hypothetical protein [Chloroflexota bacterium]